MTNYFFVSKRKVFGFTQDISCLFSLLYWNKIKRCYSEPLSSLFYIHFFLKIASSGIQYILTIVSLPSIPSSFPPPPLSPDPPIQLHFLSEKNRPPKDNNLIVPCFVMFPAFLDKTFWIFQTFLSIMGIWNSIEN